MKINNSKNKDLLEYKKISSLIDKTYKEVIKIVKKQNKNKNEEHYYYAR